VAFRPEQRDQRFVSAENEKLTPEKRLEMTNAALATD
jgi:hypothetical protein